MNQLSPSEKDIFYLAGYILLAELIDDDNIGNNNKYRQQMMSTCCLFGAVLKQHKPEYASIAFKDAMALARHNELLEVTPIYAHALKKYQETSGQTTFQPNTYRAPLRFVVNLGEESAENDFLLSILNSKLH